MAIETFNSKSKILIRSKWNKEIIKFISTNLKTKLVYLGLPSPSAEDILEWIDYINEVIAFQCREYPKPSRPSQDRDEITTQHKTRQETEEIVIKDKKLTERKKSKTVATSIVPDIVSSASEEESVEASIKLDIAKAYIDMDMPDAAIEILQEAYEEGSNKQCLEAKNLLGKLS